MVRSGAGILCLRRFLYFMLSAHLPLEELVRLGLDGQFRVLAGSGGLIRSVAWVSAVAGGSIKEYQPSNGELVLLTPPCDDVPLPRLASCGAAGIIVCLE